MKAGTAMDPFPESYPGDPMANVREPDPPPETNGEDDEDEGDEPVDGDPPEFRDAPE